MSTNDAKKPRTWRGRQAVAFTIIASVGNAFKAESGITLVAADAHPCALNYPVMLAV